jgi:hypothetical protein
MSGQPTRPTWPFFLLFGALFVLVLLAPRKWERAAGGPALPVAADGPPQGIAASPLERPTPLRGANVEAAKLEAAAADAHQTPTDFQLAKRFTNLPLLGPDDAVPTECDQRNAEQHSDPIRDLDPPPLSGPCQIAPSPTPSPFDPPQTTSSEPYRPSETLACDVDSSARADDRSGPADAAISLRPAHESAHLEMEAVSPLAAEGTADSVGTSAIAAGWAAPAELRDRLVRLRDQSPAAPWASNVLGLLDQLASAGGPRTEAAQGILPHLAEAVRDVERIAMRIDDQRTAEQLRRTGCGLERRLAIWEHVASLPRFEEVLVHSTTPEPERLLACLSQVDEITRSSPQGEGWRRYLLVDRLRELAQNRQIAREKRRQIAREVLTRLTAGDLSLKQRRFASAHPLLALRSELRQWAAEPIDLDQLMQELELYEETGSATSAEMVTAFCQQLDRSDLPTAQRLARDIDNNYRAANVRLVISDTLLNRLMPQQDPRDEYLREEILGIPTVGHAYRTTDLRVRLIPDPKRLRFAVEASGTVYGRTSARSTGAKVLAGMSSTYQLYKPFEMTLQGLRSDRSEADAQARTHLRGVETPLTGVPLLGSVVDGFVRQQYHEKRRDAERELRKKVINKAVLEMERQVESRVTEANEKMRQTLLVPLERLELKPAVAEMQTSTDRMTLRLRLAAEHQLAANTPRPRAPSDSLASFQIHESVLNNVFNQLDLNGRTFSQAELFRWVAQRLNRPADSIPDNLRDDVYLTFAPSDSFIVHAKDGHLEINLALDELRAEGTSYRDFLVRVHYRPDEEGGRGELVRDGVVQLIGKSITLRGQVALRGIFSKTFPREKRFSLLPARIRDDPKLADLRVTQMVVTDGWLGIALGEDRTAILPSGARAR